MLRTNRISRSAVSFLLFFSFPFLLMSAPAYSLAVKEKPRLNPSHFFYKVTSGKSQAVSWLFGSIHVGDDGANPGEKVYPLPLRVLSAFNASDVLAVELNPETAVAALPSVTRAQVKVSSVLKKDEQQGLAKLVENLAGSKQNEFLSLDVCLSFLVVQQQVIQSFKERLTNGVDVHFIKKAQLSKKRLLELETVEAQLDALVFNKLSPAQAGEFCGGSLRDVLTEKNPIQAAKLELEKLIRFWKRGDEQELLKLFSQAELKAVSQSTRVAATKILGPDRNVNMVTRLMPELRAGRQIFVVIGAAHLVGEGSVPDLLRKAGFTVTRN